MGSWAEYIIKKGAWFTWDENIKYTDVALAFSNPLTSMEFIRKAKEKNAKCIMQTAAVGSLGQMVIKLCKENNIELINIVTGKRDSRQLKEMGVKYKLNTNSSKFNEKLRKLVGELKPSILFDSVGGETLSNLII